MNRFAVLFVCLSLALLANASLASPILYDGFGYTPAAALNGQTNANVSPSRTWDYVGAGGANTAAPTIGAGSLTPPAGVPAPGGNSVLTNNTQSGSARITIPGAPSTGTLWYSGLVKVNDITGLTNTTTGSFFAGFNNTSGPGASIGTAGAALMIHRDPAITTAYNLGIGASINNADRIFDTTPRTTADTLFIVASYTYNSGLEDDVARLWINPSIAAFAANTPPAATVTSDAAASAAVAPDTITPLSTFFLRNNSVEPAQIQFDELRVGLNPADVVPEPSSVLLAGLGVSGLLLAARRRRN